MVEPASPRWGWGVDQLRSSELAQAQHGPTNWRVSKQFVPLWQQLNRGARHAHTKRQAVDGQRPAFGPAPSQCVDDGGPAHAYLPVCGFDVSRRTHIGPWEKPTPGLGRHQFARRLFRPGAPGRQHPARHGRATGKNPGPFFLVPQQKTQILPARSCAH